jgi:hypothetical protein
MEDGYGISGQFPQEEPFAEDGSEWSMDCETIGGEPSDDIIPPPGGSCLFDAGDPPGSGTWVLGSVDGTCQWIDTTVCP